MVMIEGSWNRKEKKEWEKEDEEKVEQDGLKRDEKKIYTRERDLILP